MNKKCSPICIFLISVITFSCAKHDLKLNTTFRDTPFQSLKRPIITGFTVNSRSYHGNAGPKIGLDIRKQNGTDPIEPEHPEPIMGAYKDGPGLVVPTFDSDRNKDFLFFHQKYKSQMFTIADQAMGLNIYPGAILDGRSIEGVFEPKMLQGISGNIKPITISTSMPVSGAAVAYTSLPRPVAEKTLYNAALTDLENVNPGRIGAASLQFEMDSFSVYEELKTLYGYNKGIDVFLVNTNTTKQGENHVITAKSAVKLKFFQQNFTIDVNTPTDYSQLFDPTGLDMNQVTGGVTPVYVKSVTYGRMGIMVIESDSSSDKLYNAVYKQVGILKGLVGIDQHLTDAEKAILNSASIKLKYTGINKDTDETIKVTGINGFIDILNANKTYSKESPGVPVAFQLAYLDNDHGIVEAPFQINYGPFDKPYARIEYRNQVTERSPYEYEQQHGNYYQNDLADIHIVCYPSEAAVAGSQIMPLDFIKFRYSTSVRSLQSSYYQQNVYNPGYDYTSEMGVDSTFNTINSPSSILVYKSYPVRKTGGPIPSNGIPDPVQIYSFALLQDGLYYAMPSKN